MAERPQNVRPASIRDIGYAAGGHNSRRVIPEARGEGNQITNRAYRGSHRAASLHADDQTSAQQRNSRVGRHHAEPTEDLRSRW
jgi:hypothetical protein